MVHQASLYGKENLSVVNFTLAYATAWKIIEFSFSLVPNRGPGSHGVVKMIKRLATHILASSFHPQLSLFFSLGLMLKSWILLKFIILLLFLMFLKQFQNVQNHIGSKSRHRKIKNFVTLLTLKFCRKSTNRKINIFTELKASLADRVQAFSNIGIIHNDNYIYRI